MFGMTIMLDQAQKEVREILINLLTPNSTDVYRMTKTKVRPEESTHYLKPSFRFLNLSELIV